MSSISTFVGLQTALRGILAHQQAIDTTSHNVTNANTEGYSRQEAVLGASLPLTVVPGNGDPTAELGTGVTVEGFRRIRTNFLDLQYRAQAMQVCDEETLSRQLDQIEMALAEPGDNGIANQLSKFWNGWADVSNNPDDPAARQALIDQAKNVAAAFKGLDTQLASVKNQALAEYGALSGGGGGVPRIAPSISRLNAAIKGLVAVGDSPNDMTERRALLLDKLSKLGQV